MASQSWLKASMSGRLSIARSAEDGGRVARLALREERVSRKMPALKRFKSATGLGGFACVVLPCLLRGYWRIADKMRSACDDSNVWAMRKDSP